MKIFYTLIVALFVGNGAMAQWVPQTSNTMNNLNSIYFTDVNTGYAVGTGGVIIKTMDGGTNWTMQYSDDNVGFCSVHFPNTDTGYAVGSATGNSSQGSVILNTVDGGIN